MIGTDRKPLQEEPLSIELISHMYLRRLFGKSTCHIFHLVAEAFGRNRRWTFGHVRDGKRKGRKKKTEEHVGSVRNWWGLAAPQQLLPVFLSLSQHLVFWWHRWGRCVCVRGVFGTLSGVWPYLRLFLHPGELVWNSCPPKVYLDRPQQKNRTAMP